MPKIDQQPIPAEAKGVPPVITLKPEPIGYVGGKPVYPISGGCGKNSFCEQADPKLVKVIKLRSGDPSEVPTEKQQEIYRRLWDEGHVKITDQHARHVTVMQPDWRDMP